MFEKYGGFSSVSRVVLSFYDTLLDSDDVGPFFDDVDMGRLVDHQTKFIASLLGGPSSYTDEQLKQIHAGLNIRDTHFDEMKAVLCQTLLDHGFTEGDVEVVAAALEIRRKLIVE
ncbi:group 1 truncated hemoglobin [Sneathiella chinensis]|uniref:Group 1 truncated hemoglobin n=1 Tax=Sneathiella chinensis TaxID=349750 RepID=A0ABQ5U652_9PROT|nr:group 1 truncated hemoglobin [Sneathiella chinensis]